MEHACAEYTYLCRMRPPEPGSVPRKNLKEVFTDEYVWNGRVYWGRVVYDRKLTAEEETEYELEYLGEVVQDLSTGQEYAERKNVYGRL